VLAQKIVDDEEGKTMSEHARLIAENAAMN
jgi:Flp pilus assembly pilin Flp